MNQSDAQQLIDNLAEAKRRTEQKRNRVGDTGQTSIVESNLGNGTLGAKEVQRSTGQRFLVSITSVRKRLIDEDNLCEKFHVDLLRYSGCLPDDNPERTKIEVSQKKAAKGEPESVIITITKV